MKKLLVVLALVALCMSISAAQAPMTISLGPTVGVSLPMGSPFSDVAGIGFYGGAKAKFSGVVAPVDFAAAITYSNWGGKDVSGVKFDATTAIQVAVGAQYPIPMEGAKPYVAADLVYTSLTVKVPIPSYTFGGVTYGGGVASATDGKVGFAIGGGVEVSGIDISAKYHIIASGYNAVAIGGAYYFSL